MAPVDFLERLKKFYHKPEEDTPIISVSTAALLSILYTFIYVIPFYLSPKTRPSPNLSRDAPSVIRARIRAVTISCILSSACTAYVAIQVGSLPASEALRVMGWWPLSPIDLIQTLLLVAILFLGPLFESAIVEGRWLDWLKGTHVTDTLGSWIGWRNYIAGPVTEEIVFRSAILPLHLFAKISPSKIVFLTPLYFGIAHIHHFYEYTLTHPDTPLLPAIARTAIQFSYTSLFGFFASFILLRTGNLPAAILAHSFCNWMGLPRFWGRVEAPSSIGTPDPSRKEREMHLPSTNDVHASSGRLGIAWTAVYYAMLALGAFGFYCNIWVLTTSPNALVSFSSSKKH